MHSGVAFKRVESQKQQAHLTAAELKIVEQARAESRQEAAALEQMKQHMRKAFLSGAAGRAASEARGVDGEDHEAD